MTKTSINLQDLRRRIYIKAKAEKSWRFWGFVRSRMQDRNSSRSLLDGETEQRGSGN